MDPLTVIMSAVVAGAAASAKDVVAEVVKDSYAALKALVVSKFGKQSSVEGALNGVENSLDSKVWQEALKEELARVQAEKDQELVQQAQALLDLLNASGIKPGPSYQATLTGSGAIAQGEGAVAAGARGVSVGGSVHGAVITTGDQARIQTGGTHIDSSVGRDRVVHGDEVGRDKVTVTSGLSGEDIAELFATVYQRIETRSEDPDVDKEELTETVQKIEAEAAKGEDANISKVERWLRNLALMSDDIFDVTVACLTNPVAGIATVIRKVAEKAKAEAGAA